jgi:CheY-like chemotaxis protein/anti-sigma regulatory factor (Ser/Thr protein kinase)
MGTARRIEQVFVNLLLNAVHALGDKTDGHIKVRARATAEHVVVTVEDDGCGVPEQMLDVIFEPFFTTRAAGGGTGLGLSICRDIVVRSGGNLVVLRSAVGEGTTMEVTFVRARADADGRAAKKPVQTTPAAETHGDKSIRVLIIDDEPLVVRSLTSVLGQHMTVVGETVPERALALMLAEPPFDVIVCDVMMPGLSGVDIHERVAREKPGHESRFVFITGGTYTARARDYLERVPNARLIKPFAVAQLVTAVERVARDSR